MKLFNLLQHKHKLIDHDANLSAHQPTHYVKWHSMRCDFFKSRLIIPSVLAIAQTRIWKKHVKKWTGKTEWKSMFHPTLCFSFSGLVTKCVYIDVKQHNTTSPTQTSCLNMEIHSTDCCTIKCSATAWWIILSLAVVDVYAAAIPGAKKKSRE